MSELCGAVVSAGQIAWGGGYTSSYQADLDGWARCVLPTGHHPWLRPIGTCCRELFDSPIHSPGHMLDQSLFLPPEPPKCGARWFTSSGGEAWAGWIDGRLQRGQITCILVRGHAGGHDSGLGEWR